MVSTHTVAYYMVLDIVP